MLKRALPGPFGIEVQYCDPRTLTEETVRELLETLYSNRILVIKTNGLSKVEFSELASQMGEPIRLSSAENHGEIAQISNADVNTVYSKLGAAHWHTDQSFRRHVSSVTMLHSKKAPLQGGETRFCDMAAAYRALPESTKVEIADLYVEHRHGVSVSARPGDHKPIPPKGWDRDYTVYHPIVRRHPVTGESTLYGITGSSQGIRDMDSDRATELLNDLCRRAFQEEFMSSYKHEVGDILLWDNPTVMHAASPIAASTDESNTRLLWRISLRGYPAYFNLVSWGVTSD